MIPSYLGTLLIKHREASPSAHYSIHQYIKKKFVELQGFEPWTPALQRQCSSQLSYSPFLVGLAGLEPATSRLSGVRSNHLSYKPHSGLQPQWPRSAAACAAIVKNKTDCL